MPFYSVDPIRYFAFESLVLPGVKQAVLTRHGGVSAQPWDRLNFGRTTGDRPEDVLENKQRGLHALGLEPESVYDVWQVHSNHVVEAEKPRGNAPPIKADAIITRRSGITLLMRFADCVPVLLADPVTGAVGIAHAGWQGTVKDVVGAVVQCMKARFETRPADLIAGIGPSICQDHYQVGENVISAVEACFGKTAARHLEVRETGTYFNLWSANRELLERAGVGSVEVAGMCTACHPEDWYSHRQSGGKTGRFAALIGLA